MKFRALLAGLVLSGLASGCASISPETVAEEGGWLTLQTVDAAQTVNFAKTHGRVFEAESAWAMGREPSRRSVYAYMGGMAALHVGAGIYMDSHDWPRWARRLIEAATSADEVQCVVGNHRLGITAHF